MTDSEKQAKVTELLAKEAAYSKSIEKIESSYKETPEQKGLLKTLTFTTDKAVVKSVNARLATFDNAALSFEKLSEICRSHGFSMAEIVKNGFSKLRGGDMYRRKILAKELKA